MSSEILVIGSLNMDLVVQTVRLPRSGETLAGSEFHMIPGGKVPIRQWQPVDLGQIPT